MDAGIHVLADLFRIGWRGGIEKYLLGVGPC